MTGAGKSDWPVVALTIMAGITAAAHIGKAPPALPLLRAELGLSIVEAGWIISIIAAMAMATGMAAGMVADRIGHRRLLIIGLAIMAISSAAGSFANGSELLLTSRFLEGIGFISIAVAGPSLIIMSILPRHRQVVLGVWSTWVPAGIALSMFISPLILGPLGWRPLWVFWGGLTAILVVVLIGKRPSPPTLAQGEQPRHSFRGSLRLILRRPGPLLLAVNFGLFAAQWGSIMMWLPSFMVDQRGLAVSSAAVLSGLIVMCNVPGNLSGSWLLHRGIERSHMIAGGHLMMGACAIGIFSNLLPDGARFGLALLFSYSAGFVPPAMFASVPVHAPSHQQFGATSGLLLQGSNFGNFFGPPAVAAVVAAFGAWDHVLWLVLGCAGGGIGLALWLVRVERRLSATQLT